MYSTSTNRPKVRMMTSNEILNWLRERDPSQLEKLWQLADDTRRDNVGDEVHLRGLIEISNHCARNCGYCGLRADNRELTRYRMTAEEIIACASLAAKFDYGTVVIQAGEDYGITANWLADIVRRIKAQTTLAITLSMGERTADELELWRQAGADRYLLRFETSNRELYEKIHPPLAGKTPDRLEILRRLREIGYEIGSGVMIGIPGQTCEDLARDIEMFKELDLDMIGVGPFIPHPATPLHGQAAAGEDQAPATELMTYKVVALARLVCPGSNIPSTSALATLNKATGRELGLARGANVVMPNVTPPEYRASYEIYPAKACIFETAEACHGCMKNRILSLGRTIGAGRGDSPNYIAAANAID